MSTADEEWWDLQASEYVLGTLTDEEYLVFDKLFVTDAEWRKRVWDWRARLDPLNQLVAPVDPPSHMFNTILSRIDSDSSLTREPDFNSQSSGTHEQTVEIKLLQVWQRRARNWRLATVATAASAAVVGGLLFFNPSRLPTDTTTDAISTVAVLQNQTKEPMWAISYRDKDTQRDFSGVPLVNGEIVITVVGKPQLTTKQSHQLWMVLPEGSGVQSVGLMPNAQGETKTIALPLALSKAVEFAVSLEPLGGVIGPEHGPVVARNFIVRQKSGI